MLNLYPLAVIVRDAGDTAMTKIYCGIHDVVFGMRFQLGSGRKDILRGGNRVSKGIELKQKRSRLCKASRSLVCGWYEVCRRMNPEKEFGAIFAQF